LAGTGPDSAGPYAHEKPTKTGNVVGVPKPALPRPQLHVSTRFDDAEGGVVLGKSRALLTINDPFGGGRVLLAVDDLSLVQVDLFTLLARAPQLVRLLNRIVQLSKLERDAFSGRVIGRALAGVVGEAAALIDALPFEVTP
jgi:hypothetical protein